MFANFDVLQTRHQHVTLRLVRPIIFKLVVFNLLCMITAGMQTSQLAMFQLSRLFKPNMLKRIRLRTTSMPGVTVSTSLLLKHCIIVRKVPIINKRP